MKFARLLILLPLFAAQCGLWVEGQQLTYARVTTLQDAIVRIS